MKIRHSERGLTRRNWWIIEGFIMGQRSFTRIEEGASAKGVSNFVSSHIFQPFRSFGAIVLIDQNFCGIGLEQ